MLNFKDLKVNYIYALMFTFVFSFAILQAYDVSAGPCCNKPHDEKGCSLEVTDAKEVSSSESDSADKIVLSIKGMTCGGCANRIKGALVSCDGVKDASVDFKDGKATAQVEKEKVKVEDLIKAVENAGFKASEG